MLTANETTPGKVYRLTRSKFKGHYYTRPRRSKKSNPRAFVVRLEIVRDSSAYYWAAILRQHPDAVLMRRFDRFTATNGTNSETSRLVLIAPQTALREVQAKPGYKANS